MLRPGCFQKHLGKVALVLVLIILSFLFWHINASVQESKTFKEPEIPEEVKIPEEPETFILQAGMPVLLRLIDDVKSETNNVGDRVRLKVIEEVIVERKAVIEVDAPAEGEVADIVEVGVPGYPARISLVIRSVRAVDGKNVPLCAALIKESETKELGPIFGLDRYPFFIFEKRGQAEFPAGTEIKAYVDYDTEIKIGQK